MPVFILALVSALASVAGTLAGRVLMSLGIGFVVYKGVEIFLNSLKSIFIDSLLGMPGDILSILGMTKIDIGFNMIFSAIVARFVISGLSSGSITKMVQK